MSTCTLDPNTAISKDIKPSAGLKMRDVPMSQAEINKLIHAIISKLLKTLPLLHRYKQEGNIFFMQDVLSSQSTKRNEGISGTLFGAATVTVLLLGGKEAVPAVSLLAQAVQSYFQGQEGVLAASQQLARSSADQAQEALGRTHTQAKDLMQLAGSLAQAHARLHQMGK